METGRFSPGSPHSLGAWDTITKQEEHWGFAGERGRVIETILPDLRAPLWRHSAGLQVRGLMITDVTYPQHVAREDLKGRRRTFELICPSSELVVARSVVSCRYQHNAHPGNWRTHLCSCWKCQSAWWAPLWKENRKKQTNKEWTKWIGHIASAWNRFKIGQKLTTWPKSGSVGDNDH